MPTDKLKKEIIQKWKAIERVVNKFKDYDKLMVVKQTELIKREPKLLNEEHLFRCPKCDAVSWSEARKKICHYCNYKAEA